MEDESYKMLSGIMKFVKTGTRLFLKSRKFSDHDSVKMLLGTFFDSLFFSTLFLSSRLISSTIRKRFETAH